MTKWPSMRLASAIQHRKEVIQIDDLATYKRCRVQLHAQGIVLRDTVPGVEIKTKKQRVCKAGDFLVAEIDAKVGGFGIVPNTLDGAIVSSHYFLFGIAQDKLDRRFLDFYIRTPAFREQVAAQGSTNYAAIRPNDVLGYKIPLPPLPEQRRIVARIESFAERLEEARRVRHHCIELVDALASSASGEVIASNWPQCRLGEACSIITDGTHQTPRYTEEGAIFLSAQNVKPFRFMPENHRKVSWDDFRMYTARNKPQYGDVLLTRVGAGIGEAAMIDREIEFAIYVSLALIRTDKHRLLPEFLVHWLNSPAGRASSHRETLGKGHSQGNLNLKLLREVMLPVPSVQDQRRIVAYLDGLQAKVDQMKKLQSDTAAELAALLPSVLDKAFKGEL